VAKKMRVVLCACALVSIVFLESAVGFDEFFVNDLIERLAADSPRDRTDANNRVFLAQLVLKAIRGKAERMGARTSLDALGEQLALLQQEWRRMALQPNIMLQSRELVERVEDPAPIPPATMQHSLAVLNALMKQQFDSRTR
jgi:hypothetical protein